MTLSFHKLLLSELRMVMYQPGDPVGLTDELLCKAVTLNENLRSMGYVLKPDDLLRLAASPSLESFFEAFRTLVPEVTAKPMYPGFPQQVMEMSEAEFRLHQMMHYFSTYDVELLLGKEVKRGWMPEYDGPERTGKDIALLECRVIALVAEADAPIAVLKALLGRRERLTNPELALALECVPACASEQLQGLTVRFKENLDLLFPGLMAEPNRTASLAALRAICAHTGDVLRCARDYLGQHRYHLTTSEKKLLVKLLESYPAGNLKANLMQSLRLRERNLLVLQHLDYNRFSRSLEHRAAVQALRNGELLSWHGVGEALLREQSPEALSHLAQRPGYMLRMLNRLLSLGYDQAAIEAALLPRASAVSGHLIVRTIRTLTRRGSEFEGRYRQALADCEQKYALEARQPSPYVLRRESVLNTAANRRRDAGYRWLELPKIQARERATATVQQLENRLEGLRKGGMSALAGTSGFRGRWTYSPRHVSHRRSDSTDYSHELLEALYQESVSGLLEEIQRQKWEAEDRLTRELAQIVERNTPACNAELDEIDRWERDELARVEREYAAESAVYQERMRTLAQRKAEELDALEKCFAAECRMIEFDRQAVAILKGLLKAHFRQATTPLKGKKVYMDLEQFDLVHSTLETEDRSEDGGYIRSGICYKIPDDAKYVRFFVYWNDRSRVDVDLHAGALRTNGERFHVGWNADFRESGMVYSGDITHSDAAEYVDIDLSAPLKEIYANVNLFYDKYSFKGIETCFMGMMAVNQAHQAVKLYDPKNCFFTHTLTQNTRNLFYGYVDVQNRYVRFVGQPNPGSWDGCPEIESIDALFSLQDYLDSVLDGQDVERVKSRDEADVVLTMGKGLSENSVSLVDSNFFLEC